MEDSVFTKIIRGEIPAEKIFEDDLSLVILTIEPISPGHLLVIPKEQIDHLWDVPEPLYSHLMNVTKRMAEAMRKVYDYTRISMTLEGFGVPHAHIHLFGINEGLEATFAHHVEQRHTATNEELKAEADKLRAVL